MKALFYIIDNTFLNKKLDFRVQLFNVLAFVGVLVSLFSAIISFTIGDRPQEFGIYTAYCLLSLGLLIYSTKTEQYQRCYKITIVAIFLIGFPLFFWEGGGYYGTMPYFFIFAILFTIFMLEGKATIWMSALELLVYIGICICAHFYFPVGHNLIDGNRMLVETIFGFSVVSVAVGAAMFIHFRLYNRQQRELETAHEEALRLSEIKNTFLANMSHEIRTPINVMLGMTEMVLRDSCDETVSEYARKIQNAGNMLLVLVSNILDVSKIEYGKLEMSEDQYRTAILIQELYEMGAESTRKRGLAFSLQVDERLPSELWGDILRIKQIAANFLSNATKYTNSGSITLKFGWKECDDNGKTILCISVSDTGIGIKEEDLPVLFETFARIDLPAHQSIEGTGLGLAIAKDLTERMNGHIYVRSTHGSGSEFWVEIPQKILDEKPVGNWQISRETEDHESEESFTASNARILIVDDNTENLQTVKALLRRTLAHVDTAESGSACISAVRKTNYHIILMDYMMPDMDGIMTLHRLREEFPEFRAPVIALTANAVYGTEERLLSEGFAAYIAKPVQARKLEEILASHLPAFLVTKRIVNHQTWASAELIEAMSRDLITCGISLNDGLRNVGGDLSLLARVAEVFTQNYPESLEKMRAAIPHAESPLDFDSLRHLVHSLKSSAGFVGALNLSFIAERAERGCEDSDPVLIGLVMPLLHLEWERARDGLKLFVVHVHAVEPQTKNEINTLSFDSNKLAGYIDRRVRRKAIEELDRLIAEKGEKCPLKIPQAKQALRELDFDKAKALLSDSGIWEGLSRE